MPGDAHTANTDDPELSEVSKPNRARVPPHQIETANTDPPGRAGRKAEFPKELSAGGAEVSETGKAEPTINPMRCPDAPTGGVSVIKRMVQRIRASPCRLSVSRPRVCRKHLHPTIAPAPDISRAR